MISLLPNPKKNIENVKKISLEYAFKLFLCLFLFLLPWQTIWIYREPFINGVKWEYGVLGYYGTEVLLWLSVIFFILWYAKKLRVRLQTSDFRLRPTKDRLFILSVLIFLIYVFISSIWAVDGELARQQAFRIMEAFLLFFMLYLGPLSFRSAIKWFVAGAVLPAILGIWQFFTQSTFSSPLLGLALHEVSQAGTSIISGPEIGRWLRAYGPFNHPNVFGGYLVVFVTVLLVSGANTQPPPDLPFRKGEILGKKALSLTSYLLCITALFLTFSRSAWLAFAVLISIYLFTTWREKNKQNISIILGTLLLLFSLTAIFLPLVQNRFSQNSKHEVQSVSERVDGYVQATNLLKKDPWWGVGAGNYTAELINQYPDVPTWAHQPAHNVFLLVLVELGLVGLFLILVIIYFFVRQQSLMTKNPYFLYLTSYILLLLFDHYLYSSYVGLMLTAILFGLFSRYLLSKGVRQE